MESSELTLNFMDAVAAQDEAAIQITSEKLATISEKETKWATATQFSQALGEAGRGRRFATGRGGFWALVPSNAAVDDEIYVIPGTLAPLLLRRGKSDINGEEVLRIVGDCYVHGLTDERVDNIEGEWGRISLQ